MWPVLFRIGDFEITTFGLMMFVAFIAAAWLTAIEFQRRNLPRELAGDALMGAAIGGIIGGKLYYAILYGDLSLLFQRAGLVWYGGLIGGFLVVSGIVLYKRVDYLRAADGVAPGLALGYALGRIGCFLVGDDYGKPTDLPIGVAFPKGAPPTTASSLRSFGVEIDPSIPGNTLLEVHPTQLYTAFTFFAVCGFLLWISRNHWVRGRVWSWFLILLAAERFVVEFFRAKDDRFFGEMTLAQVISIVIFVIGVAMLAWVEKKAAKELALE